MPYTEKELLYATQIAYYDFDPEMISELTDSNGGHAPTLQDILECDYNVKESDSIYKRLENTLKTEQGKDPNSLETQRATVALQRYNEMRQGTICAGWSIVDVRDENNTTGMVGCLIETGKDEAIIGFRGSESNDASTVLTDWIISDLGLLNAYETVEQQSAENYMRYIDEKYGDKYSNFATTGHSLGGNLAFHAALTAPETIRGKITQAYSMDGPGYSDEYINLHSKEINSMKPGVMQHRGWSLVGSLLNNLRCADYNWVQVDSRVSGPGAQKHDTCFPIFNDDGSFVDGGKKDVLAALASGLTKAIDSIGPSVPPIPLSVLETYLNERAKKRAQAGLESMMDDHDFENEQQIKEYLLEHTGKENPEYLVRGALLHCRCGTHARRLNLLKDHGVYVTDRPLIHELNCNCGETENITFFGICKSPAPPPTEIESYVKDVPRGPDGVPSGENASGFEKGHKCEPCIVELKWQDTYGLTRIVDNGLLNPGDRAIAKDNVTQAIGEASVTTLSFLICQHGGLIEPYNSGQEYIGEEELAAFPEDFEEIMEDAFGFTPEECQIIVEAYQAFISQPENQLISQQERICKFFSNASALVEGYSSASGAFMIAGQPSTSDASAFFQHLGLSEDQVQQLSQAVNRQHKDSGNSTDKGDFAHEMVIWAVMANESFVKNTVSNVEDIDKLISFKGDVYSASMPISDMISDIDAENVYSRMMNTPGSLFSTISDYERAKIEGTLNPSTEFLSNYGQGDVAAGWKSVVKELETPGLGSAFLATDSFGDVVKRIVQDGLYTSAMVESGVALQGEDVWNGVMDLGPQIIPETKQPEINATMKAFLDHLYNEGGLDSLEISPYIP